MTPILTAEQKAVRGISVFLGFTTVVILAYWLARNCDLYCDRSSLNTYNYAHYRFKNRNDPVPEWLAGEPFNDRVHVIECRIDSYNFQLPYRIADHDFDSRWLAVRIGVGLLLLSLFSAVFRIVQKLTRMIFEALSADCDPDLD